MKKTIEERIQNIKKGAAVLNRRIFETEGTLAGFCFKNFSDKSGMRVSWDAKAKKLLIGVVPLSSCGIIVRTKFTKQAAQLLLEKAIEVMEEELGIE